MTDLSSDSIAENEPAISLASQIHATWDQVWPTIEQGLEIQGRKIRCAAGCHGCCFNQTPCAECEARLIDDYLQNEFSLERQEHFRSRVESAASSLRKLRAQGFCDSEEEFARAGGMECPFLERGRCTIYPVRPLACRSMTAAASQTDEVVDPVLCRECPTLAICTETELVRDGLRFRIDQHEPTTGSNLTIAEMMSSLWEAGAGNPPTDKLTCESWQVRLQSRGSAFDLTWRDDAFDWEIMKFPIVLPEEGEYPPDLVVLRLSLETHDIYGEAVQTSSATELRVLYKLLPGGRFNWTEKVFQSDRGEASHIVWMGDSIQERLMMWEAAKRCSGHVFCGGLGMGIFPQFALSLPQVRSVHVVEMDEAIIPLIQDHWKKNPWPGHSACSISQSPIEDFLKRTDEKFDTVYIDTWDALTYNYLPHINFLKQLAKRRLKPGGEILLWGYDLMVRLALNQAEHMLNRRDYFLDADAGQLQILVRQQPLLHEMLRWLLQHPTCSSNEFYTETYRLATTWKKDLGRLSLDRFGHVT